jgi:hypothetical protein
LGEINILDFSFDEETKNKIILRGKEAVNDYFKQRPLAKRRNSF